MGYSQHAGMVIVADGSDDAARRLERVLWNDPGTGVMRHADAGYDDAIDCAREQGLDLPMVGELTVEARRRSSRSAMIDASTRRQTRRRLAEPARALERRAARARRRRAGRDRRRRRLGRPHRRRRQDRLWRQHRLRPARPDPHPGRPARRAAAQPDPQSHSCGLGDAAAAPRRAADDGAEGDRPRPRPFGRAAARWSTRSWRCSTPTPCRSSRRRAASAPRATSPRSPI